MQDSDTATVSSSSKPRFGLGEVIEDDGRPFLPALSE